ncbi:hypothetical protein [Providencia sp. SP181]|uniref:hypothetical protein n=1 Tax=Providencia sp. SP181 TaxID=3136277 RepID=UPI003D2AA15B
MRFLFFTLILLLTACNGGQTLKVNNKDEKNITYGESEYKKVKLLAGLNFSYMYIAMRMPENITKYKHNKLAHVRVIADFIKLDKKCFDEGIDYKKAIVLYHESLDKRNVSRTIWFFEHILNVIDENERDIVWKAYLYTINKGGRKDELALIMKIWYAMLIEAAKPPSEKQQRSIEWLSIARQISTINKMEKHINSMWTNNLKTKSIGFRNE